jgi:hypothetical protein
MVTVESLVQQAYNRSYKTARGHDANESVELVGVARRSLAVLFAETVPVNPMYYGVRVQAPFVSDGWARPNVRSVVRVERMTGERVVVVPVTNRRADIARPSIYRMGGRYLPAGNDIDPVDETLVMFCGDWPRPLVALTGDPAGTVDPRVPEQFHEIIVLDLHLHLASKDPANRAGEIEIATAERTAWLDLYRGYLSSETVGVVESMGGNP